MDHTKAIASAEMPAALRAAATNERALADPCEDTLARRFVGSSLRRLAEFRPHFLLKHILRLRAPGSYPFAIARTRHFDQLLQEELRNGTTQVVMLGAGYDSRACRFARDLANVTVFELDHPATQARKRQLLDEAGLQWPDNVRFVPIDFARENFAERLAAAGFDPRRRTFFLWEGVSYYLPEAAVASVLAFVASCAPGSAIAFDYAVRSFVAGDHSTYGGKQVARWLEEIDEPFLFGLDAEETKGFLEGHRLVLESDLGPKELEQAYLRTRRGGTLGATLGHVRMALARVAALS
jgi:methyltransferase (TIGR00027 family)